LRRSRRGRVWERPHDANPPSQRLANESNSVICRIAASRPRSIRTIKSPITFSESRSTRGCRRGRSAIQIRSAAPRRPCCTHIIWLRHEFADRWPDRNSASWVIRSIIDRLAQWDCLSVDGRTCRRTGRIHTFLATRCKRRRGSHPPLPPSGGCPLRANSPISVGRRSAQVCPPRPHVLLSTA
jgi:hypothetical protein